MTDQHGNAWYVNDTRGYIDAGPSCDECGACECPTLQECIDGHTDGGADAAYQYVTYRGYKSTDPACVMDDGCECIGLSVAYVHLVGGESLCEACFEKSGVVLTDEEGE